MNSVVPRCRYGGWFMLVLHVCGTHGDCRHALAGTMERAVAAAGATTHKVCVQGLHSSTAFDDESVLCSWCIVIRGVSFHQHPLLLGDQRLHGLGVFFCPDASSSVVSVCEFKLFAQKDKLFFALQTPGTCPR